MKPSSVIASLNAFLDTHDLLRVRSQLTRAELPDDSKYPIIFKSHSLLNLIIAETHRRALHTGPQLTLSLLRQKLWIMRTRPTVQVVLYRGIPCTRERALIPEQIMGELPDFWVRATSNRLALTMRVPFRCI